MVACSKWATSSPTSTCAQTFTNTEHQSTRTAQTPRHVYTLQKLGKSWVATVTRLVLTESSRNCGEVVTKPQQGRVRDRAANANEGRNGSQRGLNGPPTWSRQGRRGVMPKMTRGRGKVAAGPRMGPRQLATRSPHGRNTVMTGSQQGRNVVATRSKRGSLQGAPGRHKDRTRVTTISPWGGRHVAAIRQ